MAGIWIQLFVALLAGASGAWAVLLLRGHLSGRTTVHTPASEVGRTRSGTAERGPDRRRLSAAPDPWTCELNRCEQAVCRAARAADTVSSEQARRGFRCVVHRMDAELPHVRALVEIGRSLENGIPLHEQGEDAVPVRVHQQLTDAARRFVTVTDDLARSVAELVADADLERARRRVAVLRDQFPLLPSMSAVLRPSELAASSPQVERPSDPGCDRVSVVSGTS